MGQAQRRNLAKLHQYPFATFCRLNKAADICGKVYGIDYKNVLNMIMLFYGLTGPIHIVPNIFLAPSFIICALFLDALVLDLLTQLLLKQTQRLKS